MRARAARVRVGIWLSLGLAALAAACAPAGPKPAEPPPAAPQNPPDVRAAIPRPTPIRLETKFPPPQQSEAEEERESNRPNEPELLHSDPAITVDGEPFPARHVYDPAFPEARRLRFVSADASADGDGTSARPWSDLGKALCRLEPGDRLVVLSGIYIGAFAVSGACRDGTAEAPIQVWAHHSFLRPSGDAPVLTVERAHWQFWEVQLALTDSMAAGLVLSGPGAHDIAVDQTHIYEGEGPAVVVGSGASNVTISNCHIHQSGGVRIEAGASRVTVVSSHIHHNKGDSLRVAGKEVDIVGSRFHNDQGRGVVLEGCSQVRVRDSRFSNYRPREGRGGEAVLVEGCSDVLFTGNAVLEATEGLTILGGEHIDVFRNSFENRLTEEAVALRVVAGRQIRFANNVVERYSRIASVEGKAPQTEGVVLANSLFLEPGALAFEVADPASVRFAHVVFGSGSEARKARLGPGLSDLAPLVAGMEGCRLIPGAGVTGRDLGRVTGFSPTDAGLRLPGLAFKGEAPDIGLAEH